MDRYALYLSRFVSQTGQGLFFAALILIGGGSSTAALGLSSILVAMVAASLLLGAPAGMLVDRIGAPRALLLGGALRLLAIVSAVLAIGNPDYVALTAFVYSAASQIFSPAELALVRWVGRQRAGGTHAALIALQYGGQALGGLLLAPAIFFLSGTAVVVAAGAVAYVVVVAIALGLLVRLDSASTGPAEHGRSWADAVAYFRGEPRGTYAAGLLTYAEVATKCMAVALPFYLFEQLDLGAAQIGAIAVVGGTSAVAGLVWSARSFTVERAERAMRLMLLGTVAAVFSLAGLGWTFVRLAGYSDVEFLANLATAFDPTFLVALPAVMVLGLAFTISRVGARTVLSETAPFRTQGKVFAVQGTLADVSVILPLLAVGALAGSTGPRSALLLIALVGVAILVLLEWRMTRLRPVRSTLVDREQ